MLANPLALIAASSPAAQREALAALRAQETGSPMAQARAARAARLALDDPRATFNDTERRQIAELLESERSDVLRLRVTPEEKLRIQALADEAGQTVSDFIRERIGL